MKLSGFSSSAFRSHPALARRSGCRYAGLAMAWLGGVLLLTQCAAPNPGIQKAADDYQENVRTIDRSPGPEQASDAAR